EEISRRVAEGCDNHASIGVDLMNDFSTRGPDRLDRPGGARNHDVDHQPRLRCDGPAEDPGAADLIDSVIERRRAIPSLPGLPAESATVELGGYLDVGGGNLDVADFAGSIVRRHRAILRSSSRNLSG